MLKEYEELLDKIEPDIQEILNVMQTYKLGMTSTASGFIILAVMKNQNIKIETLELDTKMEKKSELILYYLG